MCSPSSCHACGKTTWSGCGNHVAQVKARVPKGQWCTCSAEQKAAARPPSFFARLTGR